MVAGVGTPVDLMPTAIHTSSLGETVEYTTIPPTSGNHFGTPAQCGIYDREVQDEQVVHNMEHGHVVISYNLTDPEEARRFLALAETLPSLGIWGIVRPYSKIDDGTVAMTAWGVRDEVQGVDEERIREFYETYIRNRFSEEAAARGPIPCTSSTHRGG